VTVQTFFYSQGTNTASTHLAPALSRPAHRATARSGGARGAGVGLQAESGRTRGVTSVGVPSTGICV